MFNGLFTSESQKSLDNQTLFLEFFSLFEFFFLGLLSVILIFRAMNTISKEQFLRLSDDEKFKLYESAMNELQEAHCRNKNLQDMLIRNVQTTSGRVDINRYGLPQQCRDDTDVLIFGGSILGRIGAHDLYKDTQLIVYRGSSTAEKCELMNHMQNKKLKAVFFNTGTVDILNGTDPSKIKDDIQKLITLAKEKFETEQIFLMEVIPILDKPNEAIEELNRLLHSLKDVKLIEIYDELKAKTDLKKMYFNDVHMNDEQGKEFLLNSLKTLIVKISSCEKNPQRPASSIRRGRASRYAPYRAQTRGRPSRLHGNYQ